MRKSPAACFFLLVLALFVSFAIAPGCGESGDPGGAGGGAPSNVGSIIVGVTSDLRVGVDVDALHAVMRVRDKTVRDEMLTVASASAPLKLPAEFPFVDVVGGDVVTIELEAFRVGDGGTPLVRRIASTKVIAGKKLLLRVFLDSRCAVAPGSSAPECAAPETCIAGTCAGSDVDPKALDDYSSAWTMATHDACKPAGGGAPTVIVGEGQSDYLPLEDLEEAQVEAGPQGGHHIWVALRMKNLRQSGSITKVTGHFPDLSMDVGPYKVIFTFDQSEGGYCILYGLRFQLDQEHDIDAMLGKVLKVRVEVTDKDGDVGVGERTVTLSKTFI